MRPAPAPPRGRPYWALGALLLLLVIPSGTAIALALAGLALTVGARMLHAGLAARRASAIVPVADGVVLGREGGGIPVVLADRQLAAHGLILGASGAGKSTTLLAILSDHIVRGRPVVAIDMKGSPAFERTLAAAANAAGRRLRVWTPDGPEGWNPLQHGNATELKDKLISSERFTEPHYQRAAERYAQLALQVLMELHPGRAPTLGEVVGTMEPRRLSTLARELPHHRREQVQQYLASLTPDQQSAVRGLGTRLAIISESHTGPFLELGGADGVDLRRALAGEEVVLFSLNSSIYGKLSAQLGTLAIQDLVAATGHRLSDNGDGSTRQQAIVGIDEFSALGADNVISLLARGRESGVSVLLATQELADLDRAARGLRDQVLGVTAVKIVHRQDVPFSAQTVAQMAGTERVWEETYRFGESSLRRYDASRGTRRPVEQFLVHPNEIKTLRTGEAVLITKVPSAEVRVVQVAASMDRAPAAGKGVAAGTETPAGSGVPERPSAPPGQRQPGRPSAEPSPGRQESAHLQQQPDNGPGGVGPRPADPTRQRARPVRQRELPSTRGRGAELG